MDETGTGRAAVAGTWYDGENAAAYPAELSRVDDRFIVNVEGASRAFDASALIAGVRVGDSVRRVRFRDNLGVFETTDNDGVDRLFATIPGHAHRWQHEFERRWALWLGLVPLIAGVIWLAVTQAVPVASNAVAHLLPTSITRTLGDQALEGLERFALQPTTLSEEKRAAIEHTFRAMVDDTGMDGECRIHFYSALETFGPNAFAIPPCTIVVTDELIGIVEDDGLRAVLAHELGHIEHRHTLRHIVQTGLITFFVVSITGDATSVSAAALGLPTLLLELKYARSFEREADRFAYDYMRAEAIPLTAFPAALRQMEAWQPPCRGEGCAQETGAPDASEDVAEPGDREAHSVPCAEGANQRDANEQVTAPEVADRDAGECPPSDAKRTTRFPRLPPWFSTHPDTDERAALFSSDRQAASSSRD